MTVKEVLKTACIFLGLEQMLATSLFVQDGTSPTTEQTNNFNMMLKCYNLVENEIACEYMYLKKQKSIEVSTDKVTFATIDENLIDVEAILDCNNCRLKFVKEYDGLRLFDKGNLTFCYTYSPLEKLTTDNAENFGGKLSKRVLAYGTAMEFCYLTAKYTDATIWENRFKNSLIVCARQTKEYRLPKRRW